MNNQLRDYQRDMLSRLNEAWQHHRSVMVQMPTGTGKTVLMAEAIKQFIVHNSESIVHNSQFIIGQPQVLIVAHRRELLEQIRMTLKRYGIESLTPNPSPKSERNLGGEGSVYPQVVVESIQKLSKAEANYELCTMNYELVVVDEAHHAVAKTYRQLWERWPEAKFLGLTATPCRLSGEPFTDLFDVLLQSWSIREFIRKGWLSDLDYVSARPNSTLVQQVAGLRKRGPDGDYQTKEMALVMDVPESIGHLYRSYKAFADGKKGIVYAINIDHARHIAEYYQEHGVSCAVIDAKTPAAVRQKTVEDYRNTPPLTPPLRGAGNACGIDVLINVDIFSEGFDVPEVEFIQLARPTLSLNKYLQQVGRGMRVSEGKSEVTILDQVGLYLSFGLPTSDRNWSAMFRGKMAGKGSTPPLPPPLEEAGNIRGDSYPLEEGTGGALGKEKMLVNEEMVRVRGLKVEVRGLKDETRGRKDGETDSREEGDEGTWRPDEGYVWRHALWCNDHIAILRWQQLVRREAIQEVMDIYGYYQDSVLVRTDRVLGLQQIMSDGSMGRYFEYAPKGVTPVPNTGLLKLRKPERPMENGGMGRKTVLGICESEMQERLHKAWQQHGRVLLQMTSRQELLHLMTENIRIELERNLGQGGKAVHRVMLVIDIETKKDYYREYLKDYGIRFRLFQGTTLEEMESERVVLITVNTLLENIRKIASGYEPTLIMMANPWNGIDYKTIWRRWPEARVLGLSNAFSKNCSTRCQKAFDVAFMSWATADGHSSMIAAKAGHH